MKKLSILFIILIAIGCTTTEVIPVYKLEGVYEEIESMGAWETVILQVTKDSIYRKIHRNDVLIIEAKGAYLLNDNKIVSTLFMAGSGRLSAPCPTQPQISAVFTEAHFIMDMEWFKAKGELKSFTYVGASGVPDTDCSVDYASSRWSSKFIKN